MLLIRANEKVMALSSLEGIWQDEIESGSYKVSRATLEAGDQMHKGDCRSGFQE